MKYIYEIKTPEGTGSIAIGEFMPKDGRRGKFHCWWNGSGIGGDSKNLEDAKIYLKEWIIEYLTRRLKKYEKECFNIKLFLYNIKE